MSEQRLIEIQNLVKSYPANPEPLEVLKGLNLNIYRGDIIAIMGPSGSGKTTFLNILGLLESYDQGIYSLAGIDISTLSEPEKRQIRLQKIGFVFQTFNLIQSLSVQDNIELPMALLHKTQEDQHRRSLELIKLLGLEGKQHSFPYQLSIGEQQRVAFARAMVNQPTIIMCDEPTGNLDAKNTEIVMNYLKKLVEHGATILIVTHNPAIKTITNRNFILRDGILHSDT
jgi:putative ABC transport system ATP-binding protein